MTTLLLALTIYRCEALSTNRSEAYFRFGQDKAQVQAEAIQACQMEEDAGSYDSCVEMGCEEVKNAQFP